MNLLSKTLFTDEKAKGWIPWGALAPIMTLFLIVGPMVAIGSLILEPLGLVSSNLDPIGAYGFFAFLVASFGVVGAVFIGWVKWVERRSLASVGLGKPKATKTFLKGHLTGIILMTIVVASIALLGGYQVGAIAPALASPEALFQITLLLIGFALQSSVEEFIFRGWLMSVLTRKFNLLAAVVISSGLFCLMHFNPANSWHDNINTLVFALFASFWVIKTGNIWGVMGWHAGWNWYTAIGFEVPITGLDTGTPALIAQLTPIGNEWLTGAQMGPEGSFICTFILAAGTVYWLWKKPQAPALGLEP
jgi:membrane protease YdiL (CAAX protease family)